MICPRFYSEKIIKNGGIHNGERKYMCRECGRQFVENPANKPVSGEKKWIWLDPDVCTGEITGVFIWKTK